MPRKGDLKITNLKAARLTQCGNSFRTTATGNRSAVFVCECGGRLVAQLANVQAGRTKSCGCLNREVQASKGTHRMSKGQRNSYRTWAAMKQRCSQSSCCPEYYRNKGIRVCDRWQFFENFYADMGDRPTPEHTIDRIDPNGDYCPENCRWATNAEQARNTTANVRLTHNGETKCIAEWAEQLGLKSAIIRDRLRLGWSVADALNPEKRTKGKPTPQWMPKQNRWRARIVHNKKQVGLGWHKTREEAQAAIDAWIGGNR